MGRSDMSLGPERNLKWEIVVEESYIIRVVFEDLDIPKGYNGNCNAVFGYVDVSFRSFMRYYMADYILGT